MIDPRFANGGAVPFVPGYGAQQGPTQHYHQHRHHRHHKHKNRTDDSPVSRDESIHKVDHSQAHFQHNGGTPIGGGYGVPYGAGNGFYPQQQQQQQQQYGGVQYGYANQYQGVPFGQAPFVGNPADQPVKHHRRHHRHHRHHTADAAEAAAAVDQAHAVPEQLIGQRSSSVLDNEQHTPSPAPAPKGEAEAEGGQAAHQRHHRRHHHHHHHQHQHHQHDQNQQHDQHQHHHHHQHHQHDQHQHHQHHHSDEHANFGETHQSHLTQHHTTAGADGYGHINDELIFIERGDHSPHRQEPPPGYEYKGKIEVQGLDTEHHSQSYGQGPFLPPNVAQPTVPHVVQPNIPPGSAPPCPPGFYRAYLTGGSSGPCPTGGLHYEGELFASAGVPQIGIGATPIGTGGYSSGSGFVNFGTNPAIQADCQLVANYLFGANSGGVISSGGSGYACGYQQTSGTGYTGGYQQTSDTGYAEQFQGQQTEVHVSGRPTIIEVWQKRAKSEIGERSRERSPERPHERSPERSQQRTRTPTGGPDFDFERFRADILGAIARMLPRGGPVETHGRDGGTQTQIHPSGGETRIIETRHESAGEVRVIVQPIQPVFYMPRQTAAAPPPPTTAPQIGPIPFAPQQTSATTSSAPNVIYVPRNVYVPVIKPVFVPRERVIVRPQVIHVARPVLVDRPVPVTQRPIIIDRERPIPVPIRGGGGAQHVGGGSKIVQEEFVYRDNLPVAYGGRCAEFAGGANYGYVPSQQGHNYAGSSTHETSSNYQTEGQAFNVGQFNQEVLQQTYQQSAQAANVGQFNPEVLQQTYQQSAQAANVGQFNQEVLQQTYQQSAQAANVGQLNQEVLQQTFQQSAYVGGVPPNHSQQMEVLDAALNPYWQKTDQSSLIRRYGRPAYEIVHKSKEVEQQMYNELRQRSSSGVDVRSTSTVSYASGSGIGIGDGGTAQY